MDLFLQMVEELRFNQEPVVIYGAGFCGKGIAEMLDSFGIAYEGFCVDDAYVPQPPVMCGKPVYPLESYLSAHSCIMIVAFWQIANEKLQKLKTAPQIQKLYHFDVIGRFNLERNSRITDEFLHLHRDTLAKLRADLSDEASRLALDAYLHQKNTGCPEKPYSTEPQYFEKGIVQFSQQEVFVDCGAYDGDTVRAFLQYHKEANAEPYKRIIAFEADPNNADMMVEKMADVPHLDIVEKGVSDHSGTLYFTVGRDTATKEAESGIAVPVVSIDDVLGDENVTFIKMDIEGSELKALRGAEQTIRRCRPKLAICVYHRVEDLITIPQYIQSIHPDYKLYLRNYEPAGSECVLYAV